MFPGECVVTDQAEDTIVVVNDEEQYSLWPVGRDLPPGWRAEGFRGTRAACLSHIESVWTDMRPLSLRRALGETR